MERVGWGVCGWGLGGLEKWGLWGKKVGGGGGVVTQTRNKTGRKVLSTYTGKANLP